MQHRDHNCSDLVTNEKQPYTTPMLVKLGSVAELTQFNFGAPFDGTFGSSAS
jgi:hypothetical protein